MKNIELAAVGLLLIAGTAFGQSKYGLNCTTAETCSAVDTKAEQRMASAKTICFSADSEITWHKGNKPTAEEMRRHWQNVSAAARIAERGFKVSPCTEADLVLRLDVDRFASPEVSIKVTDSDSGDPVFAETRSIQDESNDLSRLALHFRHAVFEQKLAAQKQAEEAAKYDFVRHPVLGVLKFPKTMPQNERDQMIDSLLAEKSKTDKEQQCEALHAQFISLHTTYQPLRDQYDWNRAHEVSAIEKECEKHWLSNICTEAAAGTGYFKDEVWPPSTAAFSRHQAESLESLRKAEDQMTDISRRYHTLGCGPAPDVFEYTH